ncbi:MAG: aminotransferase class I/II-fold pyridoxal phosphate-dependent enzyme [Urechidicola sp.]|nr:aminotransferase class I/II-fold pyridoxal phosphate-dependent enzyme [Urechidicola sp.]
MEVNQFPNRTININGKEFLYFGGTSYLGMSLQPEFQKQLFENIKKWGVFYGSSRKSNIQLSVYEEFETYFTKFIGAEKCVTVSSGMLAGKLTIDFLEKENLQFYHYPKTHPAVINKNSLSLFVDETLNPRLTNSIDEEIVISADSILALEVTPTSFDFLNKISTSKKVTLVIDESHSLGIIGKNGKGIFNSIQHPTIGRKIMISSLGKALGIPGGVIASDKEFINGLTNDANFVSASGASPAHLATYLEEQDLYNQQRKKLQHNLDFLFKEGLGTTFKYHPDYSVIYSDNPDIYQQLFNKGIVITNFKYPTYKNFMSRIVITANHTFDDLKTLKHQLKK